MPGVGRQGVDRQQASRGGGNGEREAGRPHQKSQAREEGRQAPVERKKALSERGGREEQQQQRDPRAGFQQEEAQSGKRHEAAILSGQFEPSSVIRKKDPSLVTESSCTP